MCAVVFDAYVDARNKVRLLGLAPFGPHCLLGDDYHGCDPCLFTWEELTGCSGIGAPGEEVLPRVLHCEHGPPGPARDTNPSLSRGMGPLPIVRTVESESMRFSRHAVHGFPDDLLEAAARGFDGSCGGAVASDLAGAATGADSDSVD